MDFRSSLVGLFSSFLYSPQLHSLCGVDSQYFYVWINFEIEKKLTFARINKGIITRFCGHKATFLTTKFELKTHPLSVKNINQIKIELDVSYHPPRLSLHKKSFISQFFNLPLFFPVSISFSLSHSYLFYRLLMLFFFTHSSIYSVLYDYFYYSCINKGKYRVEVSVDYGNILWFIKSSFISRLKVSFVVRNCNRVSHSINWMWIYWMMSRGD